MNSADLSLRTKEHSRLRRTTEGVTEVDQLKTISKRSEGWRLFSEQWYFLNQQKAMLGGLGRTVPLRSELEGLDTIPCIQAVAG